jgi:hypothetical protein
MKCAAALSDNCKHVVGVCAAVPPEYMAGHCRCSCHRTQHRVCVTATGSSVKVIVSCTSLVHASCAVKISPRITAPWLWGLSRSCPPIPLPRRRSQMERHVKPGWHRTLLIRSVNGAEDLIADHCEQQLQRGTPFDLVRVACTSAAAWTSNWACARQAGRLAKRQAGVDWHAAIAEHNVLAHTATLACCKLALTCRRANFAICSCTAASPTHTHRQRTKSMYASTGHLARPRFSGKR